MKTYVGIKVIYAEPENEGYKVVYEDGYESWSPKDVFEKAYKPVDEGLDFGMALHMVKQGHKVARKGWNGKGMWIAIQKPDIHSKMQQPYIYMCPADGKLIPWLASQADMLAEDWEVVE